MGRETENENEKFLSQRETEVLAMLRKGHTNREIAKALCRSEATIKSHVKHILVKTNSKNRAQACSGTEDEGVTKSPWDEPL